MKKLNVELLTSIIKSDFFLLEQKNVKTRAVLFNKYINFLNVSELHTSIKQFIRLLQFLKKQNEKILSLSLKSEQMSDFCKLFLTKNLVKDKIEIKTSLPLIKINSDITQLLILFNENSAKKDKNFKNIFYKNVFLVNEIKADQNIFNKNIYSIINNTDDFKKILFLMIIIQTIFNVKKFKNETKKKI